MRSCRAVKRTLLGVVLMTCAAAPGAERLDHAGSVGLLLGAGIDVGEMVHGGQFDEYTRGIADLGITLAPGSDGNEYKLVMEAAKPGSLQWLLYGGYRGYFGQERLKTFFDLDGVVDVKPNFTVGPRLALGVQYDFHSLIGVFGGVAARVGIGSPTRFAASAFGGLQIRSYLLQ